MDKRGANKVDSKDHDTMVGTDATDRTFQAMAKRTSMQYRSHKDSKEGSTTPGRTIEQSKETRMQNRASQLVTLHLPEPINAALKGSKEVFRHFVHEGWDATPWHNPRSDEENHGALDTVLEGLCGSTGTLPLAFRHTVSTPCLTNAPEVVPGPSPPIELEPFHRSTSTPASTDGSFGTARSAFTLASNTFVDVRSHTFERRHSVSAFGPAAFYSIALQDAVEQASIEVEHRPEKTASRFLSSNVGILRRRRSHDERPLPVNVLEQPQEASQPLELSDESPNNTSAVSQLSEISGIVPIVDAEEFDDSGSTQSTGEATRRNAEHRESPPLTPVTVSTTATHGLSIASETDREVAEATSQARRHRRGDGSLRFLAFRGGSPATRDGATLPVERFFRPYPSPLQRHPTSSTSSSSLQSATTGRSEAASSLVSSSQDPPTFVSYNPSQSNSTSLTTGPSIRAGESSPALSVTEPEVQLATEEESPVQLRIRSRFDTPRVFRINEQGTEVCVVPGASGELATAVVTPDKEIAPII